VIDGAHVIVYTEDAAALRAFFRDVLQLPWVDGGGDWPIFSLPPTEVAAHPAEVALRPADAEAPHKAGATGDRPDGPKAPLRHELYLTCDDIETTVRDLIDKGVEFAGPVTDQAWGLLASIKLPGGGEMGLYEPRHPRSSASATP